MFSWFVRTVPFRYAGFWDVPRYLWLTYKGAKFYLESPFDEEAEEYPDSYSVYLLPESVDLNATPHNTGAMTLLGSIMVRDVHFDQSRRKTLDPSFLEPFLRR